MYVRGLSPCPVLSPRSCALSSLLFPRAVFSPVQVARATLGQVAARLCSSVAIWSPSIPLPSPPPSLGRPGAALGWLPRPALQLSGVRVCGQRQNRGSWAHVSASIFIWEPKSAMQRPPGDTLPSPAGARYHRSTTCPSLSPCQTSRYRTASPEALGHPAWLLVRCGRREGAGEQLCRPGPPASSRSEAGNTSSQVTLGAAEQPCHTPTRPLPGSAAKCWGPFSSWTSVLCQGSGMLRAWGHACSPQPTRCSAGARAEVAGLHQPHHFSFVKANKPHLAARAAGKWKPEPPQPEQLVCSCRLARAEPAELAPGVGTRFGVQPLVLGNGSEQGGTAGRS